MRLIDVDDAIEKIDGLCVESNENWIGTDNQSFVDHSEVIDILCDAPPTVDAVPVVHGRWRSLRELLPNKFSLLRFAKKKGFCSNCGSFDKKNNYCPNCGAKMDGGNEE